MPSYERTLADSAARWQNRGVSLKALSFGLIGVVKYGDRLRRVFARAFGNRRVARAARGIRLPVGVLRMRGAGHAGADRGQHDCLAGRGHRLLRHEFLDHVRRGIRAQASLARVFHIGCPVAGWLANTAMLLVAVEALHFQVWVAKAVAILTSFVVNFSLSHFVVFRVRPQPPGAA